MGDTPNIRCELADEVAVITLDDGKANAMRPDWFEGLHRALDSAENAKARAVLLRGRPGMFSGGAGPC